MHRVLLIGSPNVGKSTLFNRITKSSEHVGNFHGVTVEEKFKKIKFGNEDFQVFDLPGIYSLNTVSEEEEITKKYLLENKSRNKVLCDANTIRKNLYLCLQLSELNIKYDIFINNYEYFFRHGNKINLEKLKEKLKTNIYLINAKKFKINSNILSENENEDIPLEYLKKYIRIIKNKYNLDEKTIINALNGIFDKLNDEQIKFIKSFFPSIIKDRYQFLDNLLKESITLKNDYVYGYSKLDKFLLNPIVATTIFLSTFFIGFYLIFFVVGPFISALEEKVLTKILVEPIMNILYFTTDNVWIIEFFNSGVLSSVLTVVSFVPQVCLMFVFLSILENSGMVARMAYVFDDLLNIFGLNGKSLYIMMLGLGCNTLATTTTRNLPNKNMKIKSAIINPYISCMARLPVYVLIASAFFGKISFFIVSGLYVLGFVVALVVALILNKTILKTKNAELLLEFPPLKHIDPIHLLKEGEKNGVDFFKRLFSVILCVGVIVWILTHTMFNLQYTENISNSILFTIASKISFVFAPIGLNSAGVVCALFVGVMAKELIVSTFSICNNVQSTKALVSSLILSTSVVSLTVPSAVSFLIFSLLYCPCLSNLAVIKQETNKFFMWFCVISQFTIAYMISFVVYHSIIRGVAFAFVSVIIVAIIMFSICFVMKKVKQNKCLTCGKCYKKN